MARLISRRWAAALLFLVGSAAGCNVQVPQLKALERNLNVDPQERLRDYDQCKARALAPANLDACMKSEGYSFVPVAAQDYQSRECWDDSYNNRFPKAYCYDKPTTPRPTPKS